MLKMPLQMNSCQTNFDKKLISLSNINKSFDNCEILKDISINVNEGEFVSLLGPSGCGKSTLFNIVTNLISPDKGKVFVNGDIGYMQQKDLLLPWKTILDNVTLPLKLKGIDKKTYLPKIKNYISVVGLDGYENKYPYQLSGGMKQRASFLRTFISSEKIMLLDEPFGALDSITKVKMQKWLLKMKNSLKNTILFITHDIEEAIFLSDRIYVLSDKPSIIKEEIPLYFFNKDKEKRLHSEETIKIKDKILNLL